MADDISWEKIVATALVSSFFTACVTEPVKAYIQRHLKRNELRRSLYQELLSNFTELQQQVEMAKQDGEMRTGVGARFAMGYKRLAYDLAQKDAATFYNIGHHELYWIELLYRDFERVISGRFTDEAQRLSNAEFVANYGGSGQPLNWEGATPVERRVRRKLCAAQSKEPAYEQAAELQNQPAVGEKAFPGAPAQDVLHRPRGVTQPCGKAAATVRPGAILGVAEVLLRCWSKWLLLSRSVEEDLGRQVCGGKSAAAGVADATSFGCFTIARSLGSCRWQDIEGG